MGLPMGDRPRVVSMTTLIVLLAIPFTMLAGAECFAQTRPALLPTRDVDIRYDTTRPQQPKVRERVRWLASEHLERVDASGRATSIFDRDGHVVTLLTPGTRTFRKIDQIARRPSEPPPDAVLTRGADAVVAGLSCTDWSWTEDGGEKHTLCVTADGAMLRLIVDGQTFREARSVKYASQKPDLFQPPANYTPALAPEGAGAP
jgi:hypothetical protein